MTAATAAIEVTGASCTRGGREVLRDVSLQVHPGRVLALVGPNGAGKSTLLSVMCGDLPLSAGEVVVGGRPLTEWAAGDLAQQRSVLLQSNEVSFPFTSRAVVAMGRHPWRARADVAEDEAAVTEAMETTDVTHLAERPYTALSGGERARVGLARVLAQRTPIVLLDEPTASLDLGHQEDVFATARQLAHQGRAVVVVVHDLSLAAAHADEVAVISRGTLRRIGTPDEVLTPELVHEVYGVGVHVLTSPDGHRVLVPHRPGIRRPRTADSAADHPTAPSDPSTQHHLTETPRRTQEQP